MILALGRSVSHSKPPTSAVRRAMSNVQALPQSIFLWLPASVLFGTPDVELLTDAVRPVTISVPKLVRRSTLVGQEQRIRPVDATGLGHAARTLWVGGAILFWLCYSTMVSCDTRFMKGVNVAARPNRSVAVTV